MGLFLSTFQNKIDSKGRTSVPVSFRNSLIQEKFPGIIVFPSYKYNALEGVGLSRIEQIAHSIDQQTDFLSDEQDSLTASIFADCVQLPFDTEGRVILPPDFYAHAQLGDKAVFVGRGKSFQIWSPENLLSYQDTVRSSMQTQDIQFKIQPLSNLQVSQG